MLYNVPFPSTQLKTCSATAGWFSGIMCLLKKVYDQMIRIDRVKQRVYEKKPLTQHC